MRPCVTAFFLIMKVFSNLDSFLTSNSCCNYEFEVLNELKDLSSRCDANCATHTRFLFESDVLTIEEQIALAKKYEGLATRAVYSGSKSMHIVFEFSAVHEAYCTDWYKAIWTAINVHLFDAKADKACANPARLTRRPNIMRRSTGNRQTLLYENKNRLVMTSLFHRFVAESIFIPDERKTVSSTKHDGLCMNYDAVSHYLNTDYPKLRGNGDSASSLFKAVRCCVKYGDDATLQFVLNKAKREKWGDNELNRVVSNAAKYI